MNWNRRKFVKTTSTLAGAGSCGLFPLVGCTSVKYVSGELKEDALVIDKAQWEDSEFVLVKNPALSAPIFVKYTGQGYVALFLECTHKKCEVRPNSRSLKCPCHGSEFDHQGKVLSGPAEINLKSFSVWDDENAVYLR